MALSILVDLSGRDVSHITGRFAGPAICAAVAATPPVGAPAERAGANAMKGEQGFFDDKFFDLEHVIWFGGTVRHEDRRKTHEQRGQERGDTGTIRHP